jgi:Dolichyl-phosphate-mannose-protein mannosyltransferase
MTGNILLLCLANGLMLAVGIGLLPVLGLAQSRRDLPARLPLAYAVGLAATGILAANLALVDVAVGRLGLPLLAAGSLALGIPRLERGRLRAGWRGRWQLVLLLPTAAYLANAARLFAVKPLLENDSWALWGTRARALYEFGHPVAPVFTEGWYPALQYPLFLPALEAIDFRFFGAVDGTTIHLQELGLAAAFVGAAWTLFRRHSESVVLAAALLAIVTAPMFFRQLQANHADIPVAMLLALGVAALAAWLRSGERGLLPAATLFLAAGALTKNEGELFVVVAFVAAFAVARRPQRRPLAIAFGATVACVAPWHVWLLAHRVTATTFNLSHLLHPDYLTSHWFRVVSAQHQLFAHIQLASNTSRLSLVAGVGFACALALGSFRLTAFGAAWLVLSFGVLLCVYWASSQPLYPDLNFSADRTIDTLLVGGVLLVPVLIGTARRTGEAG